MPAVEMLGSGNFLVPHVAGEPYLRKPLLINWLIAASFTLTGHPNDWTARLPSAFVVLAVTLAFVAGTRRLLGESGAFAAGLAWLTSLGMIEKGRMIEIEALYVSLFALAFNSWLVCWRRGRLPWGTWIAPWFFLGLGLLAKGPLLLLFFYAVVVSILWRTARLREPLRPAHWIGVTLMLAIFAGWALPYSLALQDSGVSKIWSSEVASPFS
ncbi:MAG: glycosyltransferase family 39 protein, partial [Verrucomicrobiota bacterium]|nr:glycosyltransferase family 39 protein [Verrucomicrobiota bacterium]